MLSMTKAARPAPPEVARRYTLRRLERRYVTRDGRGRPIAVRCIWQVHAAMRAGALRAAPIVGIGGVLTGRDALELVLAGACAVQVGTATFHDPGAPLRVGRELAGLLADRGFTRFTDAVGHAHDALARHLPEAQ